MSEKKEMEKCNEIVHIVAPPVEAVQNKLNGFDHLKDMFLKESPFTERSLIAYADVENIDKFGDRRTLNLKAITELFWEWQTPAEWSLSEVKQWGKENGDWKTNTDTRKKIIKDLGWNAKDFKTTQACHQESSFSKEKKNKNQIYNNKFDRERMGIKWNKQNRNESFKSNEFSPLKDFWSTKNNKWYCKNHDKSLSIGSRTHFYRHLWREHLFTICLHKKNGVVDKIKLEPGTPVANYVAWLTTGNNVPSKQWPDRIPEPQENFSGADWKNLYTHRALPLTNQALSKKIEEIIEFYRNNQVDLCKNFCKSMRAYHTIFKEPLKETRWEEINGKILEKSDVKVDYASGSHLSGRDLNTNSLGGISCKTNLIKYGKMSLSSFRLGAQMTSLKKSLKELDEKKVTTESETKQKKDGIKEKINTQIKNFLKDKIQKSADTRYETYSILNGKQTTKKNKDYYTYTWYIIPVTEKVFDPDAYIISRDDKKNGKTNWKGFRNEDLRYLDVRDDSKVTFKLADKPANTVITLNLENLDFKEDLQNIEAQLKNETGKLSIRRQIPDEHPKTGEALDLKGWQNRQNSIRSSINPLDVNGVGGGENLESWIKKVESQILEEQKKRTNLDPPNQIELLWSPTLTNYMKITQALSDQLWIYNIKPDQIKTWKLCELEFEVDSFGKDRDFMWLYDHFKKDDSIKIPGEDCDTLTLCNKFGDIGTGPAAARGGRPSFEEGSFYPAHSDYILPRPRWDRCGRCGHL